MTMGAQTSRRGRRARGEHRGSVRAVGRAFGILRAFTPTDRSLALGEIARRTGLDKSTTRRLLMTLMNERLVDQDIETKSYSLSLGVLELAAGLRPRDDMRQRAQPVLAAIAQARPAPPPFSASSMTRLRFASRASTATRRSRSASGRSAGGCRSIAAPAPRAPRASSRAGAAAAAFRAARCAHPLQPARSAGAGEEPGAHPAAGLGTCDRRRRGRHRQHWRAGARPLRRRHRRGQHLGTSSPHPRPQTAPSSGDRATGRARS